MTTELAPRDPELRPPEMIADGPAAVPVLPSVGPLDLHAALLADARSPATRRARLQDTADLAAFLGAATPAAACAALVAAGLGQANALAMAYQAAMRGEGLAAATINRRLSTVRRAVVLARRFGLIAWALELENLRAQPYRDTLGPGAAGFKAMVTLAKAEAVTPKGRRDWALLALVYSAGLRRAEAAALDRAGVDLEGRRVLVVGKGTSEAQWLPMSRAAAGALAAWIGDRGEAPGPLFVRLDAARAATPARLSADGIHHIVAALGRRAGLARAVWPHGLRHQAITRLALRTGGDMPKIQRFSRHAKLETVGVYVEHAKDAAGELAELLGEDL